MSVWLWGSVLVFVLIVLVVVVVQLGDDYVVMLFYFNYSCMDGCVLVGVNGVMSVNMVVGDFNQQVNFIGIVNGQCVSVVVQVQQCQIGDCVFVDGLMDVSVSIGGQVLCGVSGVVLINQVSGNGNVMFNVVIVMLV